MFSSVKKKVQILWETSQERDQPSESQAIACSGLIPKTETGARFWFPSRRWSLGTSCCHTQWTPSLAGEHFLVLHEILFLVKYYWLELKLTAWALQGCCRCGCLPAGCFPSWVECLTSTFKETNQTKIHFTRWKRKVNTLNSLSISVRPFSFKTISLVSLFRSLTGRAQDITSISLSHTPRKVYLCSGLLLPYVQGSLQSSQWHSSGWTSWGMGSQPGKEWPIVIAYNHEYMGRGLIPLARWVWASRSLQIQEKKQLASCLQGVSSPSKAGTAYAHVSICIQLNS